SFFPNTGSTPDASKTFQPQRCGLISISVIAPQQLVRFQSHNLVPKPQITVPMRPTTSAAIPTHFAAPETSQGLSPFRARLAFLMCFLLRRLIVTNSATAAQKTVRLPERSKALPVRHMIAAKMGMRTPITRKDHSTQYWE